MRQHTKGVGRVIEAFRSGLVVSGVDACGTPPRGMSAGYLERILERRLDEGICF